MYSMEETKIVANFEDLTLEETTCAAPETLHAKTGDNMDNKQESQLISLLELIGYKGPLLTGNNLKDALEGGPKSIEFTKLVNFLTSELRELCTLDECVNPIATPDDSITFLMEISSFLNELGCPHNRMTQGHVSERLSTTNDRVLLVQHLVSELMAARILSENRPEKRMDLKLSESSQAADLRKMLQILGYPKPPPNISMQNLLQKITPTVQNLLQKADKDLVGNPIFNGTLSDKQWEILEQIHQDLNEEYLIRREMLLKRLDCTIQSFQWSDKTKGKDTLFEKAYTEKRKHLKTEPEVDLSDLLASRDDLAVIEKTSSASVRKNTKSAVNKVIIGAVPDRGGRTSEQQPPPPEMPPWQQRNAGPAGGGGGRGGGRGGYNRGASNFSRGGGSTTNYSQGSNLGDSRGGSKGSFSNNYSQGQGSNLGDSRGGSRGGFSNNYSQGQGSTYSQGSNYNDSRGSSGYGSFDSAGSYGAKGDNRRNEYSQGGNDYSRAGSDNSRGGNSYSSGSNDYSRGGKGYSSGGNDYSRGGNSFSSGGTDYSKGGNSYSSGGTDYSRGGNSYSSGGNDYSKGGSDYSSGGNNYSKGSSDYSRGGSNSFRSNDDYNRSYSSDNYNQGFSQSSGNYSRGGGGGGSYDSAGSYGGYKDYQEPKRAKTYDQFQQNKSTYADQYVQESQHNMQYQSRDRDNSNQSGRGGRSNYNRGGRYN
ncbi:hypothetical protein FQA39_LY12679 [Lamprigera yunnana]|nr:hypothetical protein FQA39_LY12679 [Lamprigera yunnana]